MKTEKGNTPPDAVWVTFWDIYEGENTYLGGVSEKPWESTYNAPITEFADNMKYVPATEVDSLRQLVERFLHWADQKCPCENEKPDPCTLCGASVANLEACKAADSTLPPALLRDARAAVARAKAKAQRPRKKV